MRAPWGKFCGLIPLLISTTIYLARHEQLYSSCVRGTLIHTSTLVYPSLFYSYFLLVCSVFTIQQVLSCREQLCLIRLCFKRYFSHHQAKRRQIKHTCSWWDKLIVLLALQFFISVEKSAMPFLQWASNVTLDAKANMKTCEPVKNVWVIESCTFGIKAEVKSFKIVQIHGKKWQMNNQMHSLRNRWFQGERKTC